MKEKVCKMLFHRLLSQVKVGFLTVVYEGADEQYQFGDKNSELRGVINITDAGFLYDALTQGEIGLGMGYVTGKWNSPSAYKVVLVLMLNEEYFRQLMKKFSAFSIKARMSRKNIWDKKRNTIENCRKEIGITYDIGNDFYELMLGPTMLYSCAIWPHAGASLDEAQVNKMKIITKKARIEKSHKVLEIGCGWGTLSNYIHEETGANIRGVALSREQIAYCREKHPHITFDYTDYRELEGEYDRIVSCGMAEHVGRDYMDTYFQVLSDRLKPGGRFVLHTMIYHGNEIFMMDDKNKYLNFTAVLMPNADSPTPGSLVKSAMKTGNLRLIHLEEFGIHYTRTAQEWFKNMEANKSEIMKKYPGGLYKAHEYSWYMGAACMETGTSLVHMVFEKETFGSPVTGSIV
ncbi:MAG: class I SAM-dependent methyltransferase [bacterium]|nr:class I SAM-dependent methyltransferase [bacterium]